MPALSGKSSKALDRIWSVGIPLNGIGVNDIEELKKTHRQPLPAIRTQALPSARVVSA